MGEDGGMSTERFNPEPTDFTPAPGDADLAADPSTGTGPGGQPLDDDAPAGDVDATAGGDAPPDDGPDGDTGHGVADPQGHGG
jgi:hypothetical protein